LHRDGEIAYVAEPEYFMKINDPMIRSLRESTIIQEKGVR